MDRKPSLLGSRQAYMGVSLAAGWAWGVSLLVGLQLLRGQGIIPFMIWAVANTLALPVFGEFVWRLKDHILKVASHKVMQTFMTAVCLFSLWIQMTAIYEVTQMTGSFSAQQSIILAYILGAVFVIAMYKKGLFSSIITDQFQWGIMYLGVASIVVLGLVQGSYLPNPIGGDSGTVRWGLYLALVLLCGPFMDLTNWQRTRVVLDEGLRRSHLFGGMFFGCYMIGVGVMAYFNFSGAMYALLILIGLSVATSTIDSVAVGFHELAGKKIGLAVGLVAVFCWQFVMQFGVMGLWVTIGTARIYVTGILLAITLTLFVLERNAKIAETNEETPNDNPNAKYYRGI